jgi:hypothetical protein
MRIFKKKKKKHKKTTTPIKTKQHQIKYILHNIHRLHPQLFPIRPGMAQVFIRQRCRYIGFTNDFVTKRNNK